MSYKAKKLINDPYVLIETHFSDVVTEFIEGLVETYPDLRYLHGFPQIKVVLRADVYGKTYDKVAVISGGGSGREPAHAGFVGEGMLTAAICGDIFTSPPVDSILAGIRAVTGPMGCLLIVKNYTGDRHNFGLAAVQAKSEGYKVETVIVGDDCAHPPPRGVAGRRGLAGTILVHKIAGAAAAVGLSLAQVAAEANRASERVGTMGLAVPVCTFPEEPTDCLLGPLHVELGVGILGEPGVAITEIQPVDAAVSHVLGQILSLETQYVPITRGNRVALMINSLGATSLMVLMLAAGKVVRQLQLEHGLAVDRVYTGSFMTSLGMAAKGFSISIMKVDHAILLRLDAPTKAPSWPVGVEGDRPPAKIPVPVPRSRLKRYVKVFREPQELNEQRSILECAIKAAANEIINLQEKLNDWDSKVDDGDCGSNMFIGATVILEDMQCYRLSDAAETVNKIGKSIESVMKGTSGILYAIFCKAAYASMKGSPVIGSMQWANALESSIAAVSKYGGASAGYRTMLDALIPASTVLKARLRAGDDPVTAFRLSSEAALSGAESTKHMQAQAVRSSYVSPDMLASVPDPGAMAAAAWYRAAALAIERKMRPSQS